MLYAALQQEDISKAFQQGAIQLAEACCPATCMQCLSQLKRCQQQYIIAYTAAAGGAKSILRLSGSGLRIAKSVPLIMGDTVEKADIEICKSPNGDGDWLLGSGASGRVSRRSCSVVFGIVEGMMCNTCNFCWIACLATLVSTSASGAEAMSICTEAMALHRSFVCPADCESMDVCCACWDQLNGIHAGRLKTTKASTASMHFFLNGQVTKPVLQQSWQWIQHCDSLYHQENIT